MQHVFVFVLFFVKPLSHFGVSLITARNEIFIEVTISKAFLGLSLHVFCLK